MPLPYDWVSETPTDKDFCVNCETKIEPGERKVVDGSDQVSHMYPMNCIRHLRKLINGLMEKDASVTVITDE